MSGNPAIKHLVRELERCDASVGADHEKIKAYMREIEFHSIALDGSLSKRKALLDAILALASCDD